MVTSDLSRIGPIIDRVFMHVHNEDWNGLDEALRNIDVASVSRLEYLSWYRAVYPVSIKIECWNNFEQQGKALKYV